MQLTRERVRGSQRAGLFRRIILGEESRGPIGFRAGPSDFIDLRTSSSDLEEAHQRIERLEIGMRLMAETMKRTYGRLAVAIQELGGKMVVGTTVEDVQHVVADALQPVATALGEVAETLRTLPYLVAAAADHVTDRVEEARAATEAEMRTPATLQTAAEVAILPIVPFELESVEEDFDALTALRRARFAVDQLDAGAEEAAS
jgi:uncharacterized protein YoxC